MQTRVCIAKGRLKELSQADQTLSRRRRLGLQLKILTVCQVFAESYKHPVRCMIMFSALS